MAQCITLPRSSLPFFRSSHIKLIGPDLLLLLLLMMYVSDVGAHRIIITDRHALHVEALIFRFHRIL